MQAFFLRAYPAHLTEPHEMPCFDFSVLWILLALPGGIKVPQISVLAKAKGSLVCQANVCLYPPETQIQMCPKKTTNQTKS